MVDGSRRDRDEIRATRNMPPANIDNRRNTLGYNLATELTRGRVHSYLKTVYWDTKREDWITGDQYAQIARRERKKRTALMIQVISLSTIRI